MNLAPRECRSAARYSGKGVHEAARVGALGGPREIYANLATAQLGDGLAYSRDVSGAIGDNGGSAPP